MLCSRHQYQDTSYRNEHNIFGNWLRHAIGRYLLSKSFFCFSQLCREDANRRSQDGDQDNVDVKICWNIVHVFPPRRSRLLDARGRSQDGDRGKKSKVLGSRARFKVSSMPAHISLENINRKKHKYTITRIACQTWLELTH